MRRGFNLPEGSRQCTSCGEPQSFIGLCDQCEALLPPRDKRGRFIKIVRVKHEPKKVRLTR